MTAIAVGLDHSPESEAAARWAAIAATRREARVLLVHGYTPTGTAQGLAEFDIENIRDAALVRADTVAEALRREHPLLQVDTLVRPDLPIPLLLNVSEKVTLLVLGHHRATWLERLTAGSVSAALAARAKCAVVTVPYGNVCFDGPVVAAIDVDAPSEQALENAFDVTREIDQPVTVVCAVPDDAAPEEISDAYARAEELLVPWRGRYPDRRVTIQLVNGDPHRSLAKAVPHASLLVISRPRSGVVFPAWTTSVTRAAHHASRYPVAVVDHSAS
ncbi:stress protein [Gordonia paraffinivorans]|uniref:universal stress protein n=1 Tax=Gordonia paraffinivorans TaxID=175628 RepID=UPI001C92E6A9|nr:universal stress protein [Gordonia paraffinivorans]MBY4573289.1 stress protein [Gordonia paraffinivorans]